MNEPDAPFEEPIDQNDFLPPVPERQGHARSGCFSGRVLLVLVLMAIIAAVVFGLPLLDSINSEVRNIRNICDPSQPAISAKNGVGVEGFFRFKDTVICNNNFCVFPMHEKPTGTDITIELHTQVVKGESYQFPVAGLKLGTSPVQENARYRAIGQLFRDSQSCYLTTDGFKTLETAVPTPLKAAWRSIP